VKESPQRLFVERRQGQLDLGRVGGALGKVVATETRRPPEGRQQVVDQGQVDHLLQGDPVDPPLPPGHGRHLGGGQPVTGFGLQGERRVQVAAAGGMLDLGRFSQQVQQLLAALNDQPVR
jgi:hypothetical protein